MPVCVMPDCGRQTLSLGLCKRHYQIHCRRGDRSQQPDLGLIASYEGATPQIRLCSEADCGREHHSGGLCRKHYMAHLKLVKAQRCTVDGCDKPLSGNGLCQMHYHRLRLTGTLDAGPKGHASLAERLWRKVQKAGPADCWLWIGNKMPNGYGHISRGGRGSKNLLAHRAVMEVVTGAPVPDHLVVMHSCDNPACVNPAHLSVGTHMDNSADMIAKGRHTIVAHKGVDNPHSKLTDEAVRDIRSSRLPQAALARKYGVSEATVAAVVHGRTWKHVT